MRAICQAILVIVIVLIVDISCIWAQSIVAAVLPSSRSVQVGTPATAFATIINVGPGTATSCGISLITNIPATFSFQTTNPATNQITGSPNTPVSIGAGALQSFVIALTPTATVAPTNVQLSFDCINTTPAPIHTGLNTLLFSASATPVPDIVALAATVTGDGIVNIPGSTASGVLAVATANVGASGSITASADTGSAALPMNLLVCQTSPATGACLGAPSGSVTTTINAGATPTFGIFVQGTGNVVFNPATNRIFTRFKDNGGVTRGSTSVAVRTVTVPGSFAGTYSGIFSGDDSGTWAVVVDAAGNLTGSGFSNDIANFNISGTVTASGAVFFTAGTVTTGASFSGMISASGVVSGTWVDTSFGVSGTFSGSKQ